MAYSLYVQVVPRSSKQRVTTDTAGLIKIYLTSIPEGGAANDELVRFLAKLLKVPQRAITIMTGAASRKKRLHIEAELTESMVYQMLGLEKQRALL